jgi:hypothetical protein
VRVGAAEAAPGGEEGLRVAAEEVVQRAGDEGEGRVRGAREEREAVEGQVVRQDGDEASADVFRRISRRRGGCSGHGSPSSLVPVGRPGSE